MSIHVHFPSEKALWVWHAAGTTGFCHHFRSMARPAMSWGDKAKGHLSAGWSRYGGLVWLGNHQNISRVLKLVRNQNLLPSASVCFHLLSSCCWQSTCHLRGTSSASITFCDDKLLQNRGMCCMLQLSSTIRIIRGVPGRPAAFIVGLDDPPVINCDNQDHTAACAHGSHHNVP